MDSITHIVIGACIGEALLPKSWGKKALLIGAIAQSFPDIDIIGTIWLTPEQDLLFHRSITHSFLFAIAIAFFSSLLLQKKAELYQTSFLHLLLFFLLQLCLHDVLDTCNAYGTGLLEPFSHHRFSFHLLYVADPLFTIIPLIAFFVLLMRKNQRLRKRWMIAGLIVPVLYLFFIVISKQNVNNEVEKSLVAKGVQSQHVIVTPTTFNSLLWYVIAPSDNGYYIGYRSLFDNHNFTTPFTFYPQNRQLLQPVENTPQVTNLVRFADTIYTAEKSGDTLVFNVLRFGQVFGWRSEKAGFAFRYYLDSTFDNSLVVQRGRFQGWNKGTVVELFKRIKGR